MTGSAPTWPGWISSESSWPSVEPKPRPTTPRSGPPTALHVFDASALLAYLKDEDGSAVVEAALGAGGVCGAANWAEVAQKIRSHGRDWALARSLLLSYDLGVEPVTADDAERAAAGWRQGHSLSLADRLCLALDILRRMAPPPA